MKLTTEQFIAKMVEDSKVANFTPIKMLSLVLPSNNVRQFTKNIAYKVLIFDGEREHPYIIERTRKNKNGIRNEEEFSKGKELRIYVDKTIGEIARELNLTITKKKWLVHEDIGGWVRDGHRYQYKEYYTEI